MPNWVLEGHCQIVKFGNRESLYILRNLELKKGWLFYLPQPLVRYVDFVDVLVLLGVPLQVDVAPLLPKPALDGDELVLLVHIQNLRDRQRQSHLYRLYVFVHRPNQLNMLYVWLGTDSWSPKQTFFIINIWSVSEKVYSKGIGPLKVVKHLKKFKSILKA